MATLFGMCGLSLAGRDVVLDDTLCFRWLRARYAAAAERHAAQFVLLYVATPLPEILHAMAENDTQMQRHPIHPDVFEEHARSFEHPTADEHPVVYDRSVPVEEWIAGHLQRAILFDMDGLLIDSEPLWHEAEIYGFGLAGLCLTPEQCLETTGLRVDEVVQLRYAQRPWESPSREAVAAAIVERVVELVHEKGVLKPGVAEALDCARGSGGRIALASSSPYVIIDAVLDTFGLRSAFEVIHSAEEEARGKPEPDVYLTAARKLGVDPAACIALEDSPNGVVAAKAAGMRCIAIPEPVLRHDPRLARADAILGSLLEFDAALLNRLWARGENGSCS